MALLLPLLVTIAFGIVELSTAYNRSQAMQAAVREGGRFAALGEDTDGDGVNLDDIRERVHLALQGSNAAGAGFPALGRTLDDVIVEASDDASSASTDFLCAPEGDATEVTVTAYVGPTEHYTVQLLVVTGPGFDYRSEATFPCLQP